MEKETILRCALFMDTAPYRKIPYLIMNKYGYVFVWIRFEDSLRLSTKVVFDMLAERSNSDV